MNISGLENVGILQKVKLNKRVNSHSSCEIEMIFTGDSINELKKYIGSEIVIENDERKHMRGEIHGVTLKKTFSVSTIVFFADSFSTRADKVPGNRIFQDTKKKYSDIVSCLENDNLSVKILERSFADEQTNLAVIQHNETDFEFAKRLALSRGLYLFIDDTSQKCSINICKCFSSKKKTMSDDQIVLLDYEINQYEERFMITSREYFDFGSEVSLNGYDYLVIGFSLLYENGAEIYKYVLSRIIGNEDPVKENDSFILGKGRIKSNDDPEHLGRLQVAFLEYEDRLSDNKLWIPYINNLTEKDCGMMFIPDVDEIVNVYYCNSVCYASGCVREKAYNSQMNDVAVRSILTRNVKIDISDKCIGIDAFDYRIQIDNSNAVVKKDKVELSIDSNKILLKNDKSSVLTESSTIKALSDKKIQLKANEVDVDGRSKVTIKTSALDIG